MLTISERIGYFIILLLSLGVSIRVFAARRMAIRRGRISESGAAKTAGAWRRVLVNIAGQWSALQNTRFHDLAGVQHVLIFWGSIFFLASYLLVIVVGDSFGLGPAVRDSAFLKPAIVAGDIAGVSILTGLFWGLLRRSISRPARLGSDYEAGKFFLIVFAAFLLIGAYYAIEGIRLNLGLIFWAGPISALCARIISFLAGGTSAQQALFPFLWWSQTLLSAGFILYIPFSSHQHPFFAPVTIFQGPHRLRGRLSGVAMNDSYAGISKPENFSRRQLTELYACTQCGRCQDACPASAAGKPLSPKRIVQKLKDNMDAYSGIGRFWRKPNDEGGKCRVPMARGLSDDELWSCTTCMACIEECPVFVSALDKLIDVRRDRVLVKATFFAEMTNLFNDIETFGDSFGKGRAFREDWLMGKDVKVLKPSDQTGTLFWVGCLGAFHDRTKIVAAAFIDLLKKYEPDFAILGKAEMCCGDPGRRLGNEYLFQKLARKNIEALNTLHFDRIVTYCPHCYNTLKNEYPDLGGRFEVFHYTELLAEWIRREQTKVSGNSDRRLVFHDPCYLARGNNLVAAPREILKSITGAKTSEACGSKEKTFCCGGGGGQMWVRETGGDRINELRVKQLAAGCPDVIATSCPYCMVMIEDGLKSLPGLETLKCKDLIEIVRDGIS
ncbi:MAG: 4Fe-4S dicluster domain-containing protein [Desulfobacteraceae bacterium]|nr:MAG: 4Fe-4S dicluster domain-containing protein [Desulfobacteraceae bacterium]